MKTKQIVTVVLVACALGANAAAFVSPTGTSFESLTVGDKLVIGEDDAGTADGTAPEVKADEFESKAAQIAANAMGDACTGCNPRAMDAALMEKVLRCCWDDSEVDF